MDVSQLGAGAASVKAPGHQIINLVDSDDDSDLADALLIAQRGNGVNVPGLEVLDASGESGDDEDDDDDDENEDWDEVESLFEDTLEELGDESLFDRGEYSETTSLMMR
jgi:NAD-dependent histone deacetylase SIR2